MGYNRLLTINNRDLPEIGSTSGNFHARFIEAMSTPGSTADEIFNLSAEFHSSDQRLHIVGGNGELEFMNWIKGPSQASLGYFADFLQGNGKVLLDPDGQPVALAKGLRPQSALSEMQIMADNHLDDLRSGVSSFVIISDSFKELETDYFLGRKLRAAAVEGVQMTHAYADLIRKQTDVAARMFSGSHLRQDISVGNHANAVSWIGWTPEGEVDLIHTHGNTGAIYRPHGHLSFHLDQICAARGGPDVRAIQGQERIAKFINRLEWSFGHTGFSIVDAPAPEGPGTEPEVGGPGF